MRIYKAKDDGLLLNIIATPIGNINEISYLGKEILNNSEIIICENSNHAKNLLSALKIDFGNKKFISLNKFNENNIKLWNKILDLIKQDFCISLISDAGYPLISDPGFKLIKFLRINDIYMNIVSGSSSILSSLLMSTLPTNNFFFLGFLPNKITQKIKKLNEIKNIKTTVIIFESINKIIKCLEALKEVFGPFQEVTICREISKPYEEIITGTIDELMSNSWTKKGEIVILLNTSNK